MFFLRFKNIFKKSVFICLVHIKTDFSFFSQPIDKNKFPCYNTINN